LVTGIIPLIQQHEGFDTTKFKVPATTAGSQYNSHAAILRRRIDAVAAERYESTAGLSTGPWYLAIHNGIFAEADSDSRAMDSDNTRNVITNRSMGCDDFTYDYTRLPRCGAPTNDTHSS
jgi:hypothetical protein